MTSNGSLAYPAEYYYPEFADNRPDDYSVKTSSAKASITSTVDHGTDIPRKTPITPVSKSNPVSREQPITYVPLKSPLDHGTDVSTKTPVVTPQTIGIRKQPALTTSVDNGIGLSTRMPVTTVTTTKKKPVGKDQPPSLAVDVATNQGLPSTDITEITKTDPKKNLVRDPAERNIPRLIVDDSVIKQAVRTPRIITTNLDDINEHAAYSKQINSGSLTLTNGHVNGDLTKKTQPTTSTTKKQKVKYVEDDEPVDDYWKKEVHVGDDGLVTIEVRFRILK